MIRGGSPRGPWRQRPWGDPDGFAAAAIPWREQHVAPGGLEAMEVAPAAEPPAVNVGRPGGDWTIAIALPPGTAESWVGR